MRSKHCRGLAARDPPRGYKVKAQVLPCRLASRCCPNLGNHFLRPSDQGPASCTMRALVTHPPHLALVTRPHAPETSARVTAPSRPPVPVPAPCLNRAPLPAFPRPLQVHAQPGPVPPANEADIQLLKWSQGSPRTHQEWDPRVRAARPGRGSAGRGAVVPPLPRKAGLLGPRKKRNERKGSCSVISNSL